MLLVHRLMAALIAGATVCVLAGCETTSTAGSYRPANCAMVGSSCSGR